MRKMKWIAPLVAMGLALGLSGSVMAAGNGSVSGTVTGTDGKPAANVTVQVVSPMPKADKAEAKAEEGGAKKGEKANVVASGTTDENGKFEIKDVPAGEYVVRAGNKASGMGREKVTVTAGGTRRCRSR
jgi:hypothetical protein